MDNEKNVLLKGEKKKKNNKSFKVLRTRIYKYRI